MTTETDQQWIGLLSGARLNYNYPDQSNVTIEDLAAALSKICRFSGHLPTFYSVAQHLVNTSRIVPQEFAFDALMHDTAEAFTNDIPTPLKWVFPDFKKIEERLEQGMSKIFGFSFPYPSCVKQADTCMLLLEKKYVKKDTQVWPYYEGINFEHYKQLVDLSYWSPKKAEANFLERYYEITNGEHRKAA